MNAARPTTAATPDGADGSPRLPRIAGYPLPAAHALPAARAPWRLERERCALLVHDMQRYFVAAFEEGEAPIADTIANTARLLDAARAAGLPVFYTAQSGGQPRSERGLQADLWGPGMRPDPEHRDIVSALAPQPGDTVLEKHRYSAFQRSDLETRLRTLGRDQLLVTGVYAHIGCLATAVDAFQRDIEPFPVIDAQADFSRDKHEAAMQWIGACCGVPMATDAVLEVLR